MKEIILSEITLNIESSYALKGLNPDSIKTNIDKINAYITSDVLLEDIIIKPKERWLIKARLGMLDSKGPLSFKEIVINYFENIRQMFDINYSDKEKIASELRKKFCIYIRRINNAIIKDELENGRNTIRSHVLNERRLRQKNRVLTEENKTLKNLVDLLCEESEAIFIDDVLSKVKKYIG